MNDEQREMIYLTPGLFRLVKWLVKSYTPLSMEYCRELPAGLVPGEWGFRCARVYYCNGKPCSQRIQDAVKKFVARQYVCEIRVLGEGQWEIIRKGGEDK